MAERLQRHSVVTATGCREWTGRCGPKGYGRIRVDGKLIAVHRVAWELTHGPIPDGIKVLHHCDNPPCFGEACLFLGTDADNAADREAKGRGYHPPSCPADHLYDEANTYVRANGGRVCKRCRREKMRSPTDDGIVRVRP